MMPKQFINAVILGLLLSLVACYPIAGTWKFQEVQRIKSPDGKAEAVLLNGDAGATTSTTTVVLIVGVDGKVKLDELRPLKSVFWGDHVKNLDIHWKDSAILELRYDEARIDHFQNLSQFLGHDDTYYSVEIRLEPSDVTHSVPTQDKLPVSLH